MKKGIIALVIIGGLMAFWYTSRNGSTTSSSKKTVNIAMDVEPNDIVQEEEQELSKSEAYRQDYYEAELSEKQAIENEKDKEAMNVVAYQFNSSFDNPEEYTIVGADEKKEETKVTVPSDISSPVREERAAPQPKRTYTRKKTTPVKEQQTIVTKPVEEPKREAASFNSSSFNSSSFGSSQQSGDSFNSSSPQKSKDKNGETTPIIEAVVYGDHNIRNGDPVRFRIRENVVINGVKIPRNTIFSAPSTFSGKRLQVNVKNIPAPNGRNIPTDLYVYDLDLLKGISININTEGKAAKESGSSVGRDILRDATSNTVLGSAANSLVNQITRGEIKIDISQGHEVTLRIQ